MNIRSTIFFCATLTLPLSICDAGRRTRKKARKPKVEQKIKQPEITHLEHGTCDYEQTKNGVTVRAKVLKTEQECIDAFGGNGDRLLKGRKKRRIVPIKLTIANNSRTDQWLVTEAIKVKIAPINRVAKKLHDNNWTRSALWGVGIFGASVATGFLAGVGILIVGPAIGLLSVTCPCCIFVTIGGLMAWGGILGAGAGSTTAAYQEIGRRNKNKKVSKEVEKSSIEATTIGIGQKKSLFLFVRQPDYKPNFEITFTNENQQQLSFDLQLPAL